MRSERHGGSACATIELAVAQFRGELDAVTQVAMGDAARIGRRARAQQADE